jgi:hypothetical protein
MANQKEIQVIRNALRLIATGETSDARRMLAGLTVSKSVRPAAPKPIAAPKMPNCRVCWQPISDNKMPWHGKGKGFAHYACQPWAHPVSCECPPCRRWRARAGKPINFTGLTKMLPPQNMEQLLGQKQRVRVSAFAAKAKLRLCACGHDSDAHIEDELNNLLECKASGCTCDHFNYRIEETAQSAAAGN